VYAPCLILALAYPCLSPKLRGAFRSEFLGSIVMVGCTFSAGKWWGLSSQNAEWALHAAGVVAADRASGGPDVNPAVTFSMFALGKLSLDAFLAKVAGQLLGGYVAFPLYVRAERRARLRQKRVAGGAVGGGPPEPPPLPARSHAGAPTHSSFLLAAFAGTRPSPPRSS
jgi:glycerol uptake facilitator-like aquaporin